MNKKNTVRSFILIAILIIVMVGIFLFLKPKESKQLNIETSLSGPVKTFVVSGSSFEYDPNTITVNRGDAVKIIFKDTDGAHNLVVDGYRVSTKVLDSGSEETIEFVADKLGTFEYYCSLPGHKSNGMVGRLIVN